MVSIVFAISEGVAVITLTTSRPARSTVIRAYNEDNPSSAFAGRTNDNSEETNFPSFASSNTGGLAFAVPPGATPPGESNVVDNANGTATGFSASTSASDLLATESAEYITSIRDAGATITGDGVSAMIKSDLRLYVPYFKSLKSN